jgi:parallel beta-helix repeat protein
VAGLKENYGVMPTDPSFRGGGSVIRNNLVQEEVFHRGIYLPGVKNVTATDNLISSTNNGGIVMGEDDLLSYSYKTGPVSGITINNNVVNNALEYGYPTMQTVVSGAAIENYVTNQNYDYVATTPKANITITGNLVTNTPRSGIRVQSLNGGTITGNTIINADLEPTNYIDLFQAGSGETLSQIESDFAQPIVFANSTGVTNSGNTISGNRTGSIFTSVSDTSGGLRIAVDRVCLWNEPGVFHCCQHGGCVAHIAGRCQSQVTDNTGTARLAPLFFVSPGQINYLVPTGTAPGVAWVTIGSAVGDTLIGAVAPGLFSANGTGIGVAAGSRSLRRPTGGPNRGHG